MNSYIASNSIWISNGTSNLNHLAQDADLAWLETVKPQQLLEAFGPGLSVEEDAKGYGNTEWYFKSAGEQVWGIGWRYSRTRLRGKWGGPAEATAFINWLRQTLENNETISRENV